MSIIVKGIKDMERSYRLAAREMGKAESRAVKRTGTTIAARQARAIAQTVNLKVGVIKEALRTVKEPTPDNPSVTFEVTGKAIALREFSARQTRSGVSVLVLKGGGRKRVKGAFMARGYGNNLQVFKRESQITGGAPRKKLMKAGRYKGQMREPIAKLFGPDVLSQYIKAAIQGVGVDTWETRLPIELARESAFALKRAGLI
jgi:hypothetical protein